jgi:hypothetical protein
MRKFKPEELIEIRERLRHAPPEILQDPEVQRDLQIIELELEAYDLSQDFYSYLQAAWEYVEPNDPYDDNWHMRAMCDHLQAVTEGKIHNLMIQVPPGSAKSITCAVMWTSWEWTREPHIRSISLSYSSDLTIRDSNKFRNLIKGAWWQERWGHLLTDSAHQHLVDQFRLTKDTEKRVENGRGGFRIASSVDGLGTGERVHRVIFDDLLKADDAFSEAKRKSAVETFKAMSTRKVAPSTFRRVMVSQRLHLGDPPGYVLQKHPKDWEVLRIPARFVPEKRFVTSIGWTDPRTKDREPMWESRYPEEELQRLDDELGEFGAAAQLQQDPIPEGGGILKQKWFRPLIIKKEKDFPDCDHIFVSYDTAFTEQDIKQNAFSAIVKLGVFFNEVHNRYDLLLLGAWWDRVDFSTLKDKAIQIEKDDEPDRHVIEKKASGISLVQDLRKVPNLALYPFSPDRDKVARAYAIQPMLQRGQIWYPKDADGVAERDKKYKWALTLIDWLGKFPYGDPPCADLTDAFTQGCLYVKRGFWLDDPYAEDDEDNPNPPPESNIVKLYG